MISEDFLLRRIQQPVPTNTPIVPISLPVTSFGNPNTARVATVGINPSSGEFCSPNKKPLPLEKKRFVDREVLGLAPTDIPTPEQALRVLEGNHNYFKTGNAYKWFDAMQEWALNPLGVSYGDGSAVHLDIVQWATDPVWDKIEHPYNKLDILVNDREFIYDIMRNGEFDLVVLNGATVLNHMAELKLFYAEYSVKETFTKDNGKQTSVTFVIGKVNGAPAVGWSANIPSSQCGNKTRQVIKNWISSALKENLVSKTLGQPMALEQKKKVNLCPICGAVGLYMQRYPRYLCHECAERAVDGDGRLVTFEDHDNGDGLTMHYRNKISPSISIELPSVTGYPHVWVDGVECEVRAAHFGGVVMQTLDWPEYMKRDLQERGKSAQYSG